MVVVLFEAISEVSKRLPKSSVQRAVEKLNKIVFFRLNFSKR